MDKADVKELVKALMQLDKTFGQLQKTIETKNKTMEKTNNTLITLIDKISTMNQILQNK